MASFVTEVLAHSGSLEKEDLGTRISRLTRRVEEIKGEVCNMISKKYSEFLPTMQSAQALVTQVDTLSNDIDQLKSRIETEVCRDLHISTVECLKLLKSRKCFDLKMLKSLSMELTVQKQNILYHLGEDWQKLVVWKFPPAKDTSSLESCLQTELHLCTEQPEKEDMTPLPSISSVLLAFSILGELPTKLKSFGQMLLKYILKPLVTCPSLHAVIERQPSSVSICFESLTTDLEHPSPPEAFAKIRLVLEVLQKQLLDLPLDADLEIGKVPGIVLAEMLGEGIWEDLSECLIRNCLVYSIPTNSSKLQEYEGFLNWTLR